MELEHYAIDASMSRVTVRPFATGTLSATQNPTVLVRELAGEACLIPGTLDGASFQIRIKTASLTVVDDREAGECNEIERSAYRDVLEADKYPEIVFSTSKISASKAGEGGQYWINLVADLSLHGVTGSEPVAAQVVVAGDTLFARGELTVDHAAYKINAVALAGGALKLKQEVKCLFDIVARKQNRRTEDSEKRMLAVEGS
jgi:polyisoprenoid-binding protein YceI